LPAGAVGGTGFATGCTPFAGAGLAGFAGLGLAGFAGVGLTGVAGVGFTAFAGVGLAGFAGVGLAGFAGVGLAGFATADFGEAATPGFAGFAAGLTVALTFGWGFALLAFAPGFFPDGLALRVAGAAVFPAGFLANGLRAAAVRPVRFAAAAGLDLADDLRTGFGGFLAMMILAIRGSRVPEHWGIRENLKL
jgi:hypothetical protein